ncbi:MAG: sigma-70 family RNA polymerase sigma factor [Clostridia bacterium]|nr:sigma-70 family RNA polymerase sigma factor [Clostridia bacterium]
MLAAKSREEKIEENINLVHALAARFKGRGIEYDDLFQAGCIGLIKSVDGFDESKGFAFSTYAVPVILGEIKGLFRSGGAIKLSRSMKEKGMRALAEKEAFAARCGREPSVGELAGILSMSVEETAQVLACNLPVKSLTVETGEELDVSVESHEARIDESLALAQAVQALEEEERTLITLRYFREYTQSKTAQCMGITQVQVSRKEKKILQKLRLLLEET